MKIEGNKSFFSTLQLLCNIREFKKFNFKMLKNHQDFPCFVDPFKYVLNANLKRTDVRNLSFMLSVHLFVLELCNIKSSFTILSVVNIPAGTRRCNNVRFYFRCRYYDQKLAVTTSCFRHRFPHLTLTLQKRRYSDVAFLTKF